MTKCVESYAHKASKIVVMDCLIAKLFPVCWRREIVAFHEYPIVVVPAKHALAVTHGTAVIGLQRPGWDQITNGILPAVPTLNNLKDHGMFPAAIMDIACFYRDEFVLAIEINHKHAVDQKKFDFLRSADVPNLLELSSEWVLGQIMPPRVIPDKFWLIRDGAATGYFGGDNSGERVIESPVTYVRRPDRRRKPERRSPYAPKRPRRY